MKRNIIAVTAAISVLLLSSCSDTSENAMKPLIGLEWYTAYDTVKQHMDSYTLLDERVSEGSVTQQMQDYENVELFGNHCDLTLCFTDSGLIGFNYHDVQRTQGYREWHSTLESTYGVPTEEGSGMASWYDNPAGKDTAIYLFNLEDCVQISIYATADSPDKSYQKDIAVPAPEIRTPIVPVTEVSVTQTTATAATTANESTAETGKAFREGDMDAVGTNGPGNHHASSTERAVSGKTEETETTVESSVSEPLDTDTTEPDITTDAFVSSFTDIPVESTAETTTEPLVDHKRTFLQDGLFFYANPTLERGKMRAYTQLYEYRTEEPEQPWELIMAYENVPYEGKNCEAVLCFTSLGLVGVNYFDSNTSDYNYWVKTLTDIYGSPDETQYDYTAWSSSPVGSGTMIYVFVLEDGVQISFFADDTGSELT